MKVLTLLFVIILLSACKKDVSEKTIDSRLYNKWRFDYSIGGFSGQDKLSTNANLSDYFVLERNLNYRFLDSTNIVSTGRFKVIKRKSKMSDQTVSVLLFDNDTDGKVISFSKDTLLLSDDFFDGYTFRYVLAK